MFTESNIEIFKNKTIGDMWDEMATSQSPVFMYFKTGAVYSFRLLGGFSVGSRHFIPEKSYLSGILTKEQLKEIIKGNETVYRQVIDDLVSKLPNNMIDQMNKNLNDNKAYIPKNNLSKKELLCIDQIKEIDKIFATSAWQKCILCNALIRSINGDTNTQRQIVIIPFIPQMLNILLDVASTAFPNSVASANIVGATAHDVIVSKVFQNQNILASAISPIVPIPSNPFGVQDNQENSPIVPIPSNPFGVQDNQEKEYIRYNWNINLSPVKISLSGEDIFKVSRQGIFNIDKSVRWLNNNTLNRKHGFIYKINQKTMDLELVANFEKNVSSKQYETEEIEQVEDNINDLPATALPNVVQLNSINSLEI